MRFSFVKILVIFSFCLFFLQSSVAQKLHVSGSSLMIDGRPIILRGVNYPIIDDGAIDLSKASSYEAAIDQVALTGANCIRFAWYEPGTHWRDATKPGTLSGYVTDGHLSKMIGYSISKNMIPILELHNLTCNNYWANFRSAISDFWCDPDILALINLHKGRIIINLANEFGNVNWSESATAASDTFRANYVQAISMLRTKGIEVPIMIDAPDCGQSSTALNDLAPALNAADPLHNLIFSAHTYWSGYAGTKAAADLKLYEMATSGYCWILGEVANKQDDDGCAKIDLSSFYPELLKTACSYGIGWLAWVYNQDCSALREMSADGSFASLTTFGNDIVNNTTYGLKATSACGAVPLGIDEHYPSQSEYVQLFPNPLQVSQLQVVSAQDLPFSILDCSGRMVLSGSLSKGSQVVHLAELCPGIYILRAGNSNLRFTKL